MEYYKDNNRKCLRSADQKQAGFFPYIQTAGYSSFISDTEIRFIRSLWRVLDIHKASIMLQSGHNSRHLDFFFDRFMEFVKFIFYFYIFLLNMNVLIALEYKNGHLFVLS